MEHRKAERLYKDYRDSLLPVFVILQKTFWEFKRSHVANLIDVYLEPEIRDLVDVIEQLFLQYVTIGVNLSNHAY